MKDNVHSVFISICALVCLILIGFCFTACNDDEHKDKISIVCTIFPQYDWVNQIIGEKTDEVEVTLLMKNGTDMHSYEPTFSDMAKISTADVFIYIGGESDEEWTSKALKNVSNKNQVSVNMLEVLGDKALVEEIKQGMQIEDAESGEEETDEHVWLSVKNASIYVGYFAQKLGDIDAVNKEYYLENAKKYLNNLQELDTEYEKAVEISQNKTIVVADRFPFGYLVKDYNIEYFAAFPGCSTEVNASTETVTFLANKIDSLELKYILKIDGSKDKVARAVKDSTISKNQSILTLNSMQTISSEDMRNGVTYLSIMQQNLNLLKEALTNE